MFRCSVVAACALALSLSFVGSASAQQKKSGVPKGTALILKGKVAQVVPGQGILVEASDGKKIALGFHPTSKISMTGTAGADYLSPGMFVQMDVELDSMGKPAKEVAKLQITELSSINQPGIFSAAGPDGKPGAAGMYLVRGTVRANRGGQLTVAAGPKTMTVQLSGAVSVPVTTSDWRMAQPGDEVSGDAQAYNAPQGAPFTPAMAEAVTIKAAMPFQTKKGR